ncbi:MAG: ASCH domain-containing protein, partial [Aureliella sp.]
MKAITISQPFATLIASGEKWIENRTWPTSHRGRIAIHAGLGKQYLNKKELEEYPTGCIVAIGKLVACERIKKIVLNATDLDVQDQLIPG